MVHSLRINFYLSQVRGIRKVQGMACETPPLSPFVVTPLFDCKSFFPLLAFFVYLSLIFWVHTIEKRGLRRLERVDLPLAVHIPARPLILNPPRAHSVSRRPVADRPQPRAVAALVRAGSSLPILLLL